MARGLGCNGSIRSNGRCELGRCAAQRTLAAACDHLQANISRAAGNARSLALAQAAHGAALAQAGNAVAGELGARSARASALNPSGGRQKTGLDRCLSRRHPHSARQARRSSHTTGARTDEVPGNLWRCAPTDTLDEECPQSDGLKLAGNTVRKRTTRTAAAAILRHCLGDASRQL